MLGVTHVGYLMNEATDEQFPIISIEVLGPLKEKLIKRQNQLIHALPSKEREPRGLWDEKGILILPHGYWFDKYKRVGGDIFALIQRQLNGSFEGAVGWAFKFVDDTMPDLPGNKSHFTWCSDNED